VEYLPVAAAAAGLLEEEAESTRSTAALLATSALLLATGAVRADEVPTASNAPVPAGAYTVDKAHTSLLFRVSHLGFSNYTGRFTRLDANLQFDPANVATSRVDVNIDPRSIEADNAPAGFLQTLAGKDWLDAERFPEMTFRTRSVQVTGPGTFRVNGELTLHGITKPLTLDARDTSSRHIVLPAKATPVPRPAAPRKRAKPTESSEFKAIED